MYEHRTHPLLTRAAFARRVWGHFVIAQLIVVIALGIGMAGYRFLAGLDWIDALLNASMILGGMGPVDLVRTPAAKLFASFYALFCGLALISVASVLVAPFMHRLIHRFHLQER
jgi:hypothetical protein